MKSKNFNKRLVLNKETVANVTFDEMRAVHAGEEVTHDCSEPGKICPYSLPIYNWTCDDCAPPVLSKKTICV
jgi:hypothetical protein